MPAIVEQKSALLLIPENLVSCHQILYVLLIKKLPDGRAQYDVKELDRDKVPVFFRQLPDAVRGIIAHLTSEDIQFERGLLQRQYKKQKSGTLLDTAVQRALTRHVYQHFEQLMVSPANALMYHRTTLVQTGKPITAKCVFNPEKPSLHFELEKSAEGVLHAVPVFQTSGGLLDRHQTTRHAFLLRLEHQYWQLGYNDYLRLEWLAAQKQEQFAQRLELFLERIVSRLEETHRVDRKQFFQIQEIAITPTPRLFLSEIGDAFLMLTPRFNYDGIVLEGPWKPSQEINRHGHLFRVLRSEATENGFMDYLKSLHPEFARQINGTFNISFANARKKNWFLKVYHEWLERDVEIVGLDLMRHFRYSSFAPETTVTLLRTDNELLLLDVHIHFGKERIPLSELQKTLLAGQNSTLLKDHSIAVFPDEWLERYAPLIKHGKVSGSMLTVPRWLLLGIPRHEEVPALKPAISEAWWTQWKQWQEASETVIPIPSSLRADLRDYQRKGFEWMALLSQIGAGACLADDMGLGKTLQTIAFLVWRLHQEPTSRNLVICPASLIYNWQRELERFAPSVKIQVHVAANRNISAFFDKGGQILITTYGTVRADLGEFSLVHWDTIVLDESQNIKNPAAQATRAVQQLSARCRIALSGTPVMNNTFDLYAQLEFLLPGMFGSQEFFRREYANPIDREGDPEKVKALRQISGPFILRRTKQQVASDLPEKTESVLWCDMDTMQRSIYEDVKSQIRDSIYLGIRQEGLAKSKLGILQGIMKLRQLCCSPVLLHQPDLPPAGSVKIDLLMHELEENLIHNKVLVFSQFKEMLHLIAQACRERNIAYYHFDGDTPPQKRQEMVARFQEEGSTVRVFLISLKSGNAGLNLTAADYVFLVDPWWNTAVQQQAIDRTHRIGQTRNVFAYKMICRDTIEERILQMQQRKQNLSEELVQEDEGFVKNLTEEDVAFLFE